jgi:hypothetical protein
MPIVSENNSSRQQRVAFYKGLVTSYAVMDTNPVDINVAHVPSEMVPLLLFRQPADQRSTIVAYMEDDMSTCQALNSRHNAKTRSVILQEMLISHLNTRPGDANAFRYLYDLILGTIYRSNSTDWYRTSKAVGNRVCKRPADALILFRLFFIVQHLKSLPSVDIRSHYILQDILVDLDQLTELTVQLMQGTKEGAMYQTRRRSHQFVSLQGLSRRSSVIVLALLHATFASTCALSIHE